MSAKGKKGKKKRCGFGRVTRGPRKGKCRTKRCTSCR